MRFRKALGLTLVVLVSAPWHRLLAGRTMGPAAEQAVRLGGAYVQANWIGIALGTVAVVVLSRLLVSSWFSALGRASARWILSPRPEVFGLVLAVVAAGGSGAYSLLGLGRGPILVDGVSQLIHARYMAAGRLVGPVLQEPAFWQIQFMMPTSTGWTSQYPPGLPALLSLGVPTASSWMVGPLCFGLAAFFTTLVADRLFSGDRVVARLGAVLTAVSPFLAFHAGAVMSHAPATAFVAFALYASLRATEGGVGWALLAGGAIGAAFATRPLVGAVLGLLPVALLARDFRADAKRPRGWRFRRLGAAFMGGLPFLVGVLVYNARIFGSPLRFGYEAAGGPSAGLGFHTDPWGSPYGPMQALAYTAGDLSGISLDLLLTPLPLVVIVAIHLLRADKLAVGTRVALWWAMLPVVGNLFYWHHDLFMGPRMLYEAGPGWCLVVAASVVGVVRSLPPGEGQGMRRWCTRAGVVGTFALALTVGLGLAAPLKMGNHALQARAHGMARAAPVVDGASLVFVHDDWQSRLGARMTALGMPLDSVRRVLADHSTCSVETWIGARENGGQGNPALGMPLGPRPGSVERVMPSGSRIRTFPGETLGAVCEREASSDFLGVLPLAPFLWQGDLPGLGGDGAMFVRDLGPTRNQRLIALHPERRPLFLRAGADGRPGVVPYHPEITRLWTTPRLSHTPTTNQGAQAYESGPRVSGDPRRRSTRSPT